MAAEKLLFPRRWYGGMISTDLEVIWEIPVQAKSGRLLPSAVGASAGAGATLLSSYSAGKA